MEKNKNIQPRTDKTKKESNQKTNEDFNKKEIDPNYASSKKDYPEVSTKPNDKNYDLTSISKNKSPDNTVNNKTNTKTPFDLKAKDNSIPIKNSNRK